MAHFGEEFVHFGENLYTLARWDWSQRGKFLNFFSTGCSSPHTSPSRRGLHCTANLELPIPGLVITLGLLFIDFQSPLWDRAINWTWLAAFFQTIPNLIGATTSSRWIRFVLYLTSHNLRRSLSLMFKLVRFSAFPILFLKNYSLMFLRLTYGTSQSVGKL